MLDFPCHAIRKNHAVSMPIHRLYFDTETREQDEQGHKSNRMKMAWTCYDRVRNGDRKNTEQWRYWLSGERMWKYVENLIKDKTTLYLFAHNIFFDLQSSGFFPYFTKAGWELSFWYDKGLTYMLYIHKGKRKIKCLSTTNYYDQSLDKIGDMLSLPKLDIDFASSTEDELAVYCRRDVEICKLAVEHYITFLRKHDLGMFRGSKAAQAMGAFRHRFMDAKIYPHKDDTTRDLESSAYFGGRVECGEIGHIKGGPFVSLDVNSMYPYVMRRYRYPTKLIDYVENPSDDIIKGCLRRFCVTVEAEIETNEPCYAYRDGHKILFPIGKFSTFLNTTGLRYAINNDHLKTVKRMSVYEADNIFVPYVDYFYDLKNEYGKQNNKIMRKLTKYFLNSLYGKFAQRAPLLDEEAAITFDGYSREEIYDAVTGKTETVTKLMNRIVVHYGDEPARSSFVAIAAHVTENARFYLWEIMREIGYGRVLYCDTDSVKIRVSDLERVKHPIDGSRLGALTNEGVFKKFVIYGPKDYETESYRKLKGVPKRAKQIAPGVFEYTHFPGQTTHLRKKIMDYFITRSVTKTLERKYNKGKVLENGKVEPFTL